MREPTLVGVPFSQCSAQELAENVLVPDREIISAELEGTTLELAIDVSLRYASILVAEKS